MKWIGITVALICSAALFTGCTAENGGKNRKDLKEVKPADDQTAGIALLYTTMSNGGSKLVWLDDDLKKKGETDCDFSAASYDGYRNMCASGGIVYLFPRGDYVKKDATELVELDMTDGSYETTDIGRQNVTGYCLADGKIAFSSNAADTCYLDVFDLATRKQKSMDVGGRILLDVAMSGDAVYGMALNKDLSVSLVSCDPGSRKCEELMKLPDKDAPGFLQTDGRDLLFISNGMLVRYDTEKHEPVSMKLTREDAYNLNIDDGKLWIGYTDLFGEDDQKSLIEARDIKTGEVLTSQEISGPVIQIEPYGDGLLVLGYDQLTRYSFDGKELHEKASAKTGEKNYDVGGVLCYNNDTAAYGGMTEDQAVELNRKLFEEAEQMEVEEQ